MDYNPLLSPVRKIALENEARAKAGHAIAAIWRCRQSVSQCRETHAERDENYFLMRGSWALEKQLIDTSCCTFTDQITGPGEEEDCLCSYQYIYVLRDLPHVMLSQKGKEELERVRRLRAVAGI